MIVAKETKIKPHKLQYRQMSELSHLCPNDGVKKSTSEIDYSGSGQLDSAEKRAKDSLSQFCLEKSDKKSKNQKEKRDKGNS